MASKSNEVGASFLQNCLCRPGFESPGRHNRTFEDLPQVLRSNRRLTLGNDDVAFHPGLNNVQITQAEPFQLIGNIAKKLLWSAVGHAVPLSVRAYTHGYSIAAKNGRHCID